QKEVIGGKRPQGEGQERSSQAAIPGGDHDRHVEERVRVLAAHQRTQGKLGQGRQGSARASNPVAGQNGSQLAPHGFVTFGMWVRVVVRVLISNIFGLLRLPQGALAPMAVLNGQHYYIDINAAPPEAQLLRAVL